MLLADNTDNVCIAVNAAGKDTGGQIEAPLALQTVDTDILGIVEELEDTADILDTGIADTAVKLACNADILGIAVEELADTEDSHEEYQE